MYTYVNLACDMRPLPDGGVEGVAALIALRCVEADGIRICLGNSKGYLGCAEAHKMRRRNTEQRTCKAEAANVWMHTELRNVTALRADARAEHEADKLVAGMVDNDMRNRG